MSCWSPDVKKLTSLSINFLIKCGSELKIPRTLMHVCMSLLVCHCLYVIAEVLLFPYELHFQKKNVKTPTMHLFCKMICLKARGELKG